MGRDNLGDPHREHGRRDEASSRYEAGAVLLREHRSEAARSTLAVAEGLAVEVGAGPDSDLGRKLVETRAALAS